MISHEQLMDSLKNAANKQAAWKILLDMTADEVIAKEDFIDAYDSAKLAAIEAGAQFKELYQAFKKQ
jgi:hypothetical protein